MRFILPVTLLAAASVSSYAYVDSGLLSLVPAGAKIIAEVDAAKARDSQLGQFLISRSGTDRHFQDVIDQTGFDPRRDLQNILIASQGPPAPGAAPAGFVVLARGSFNQDRIKAAAVGKGAKVEPFGGLELVLTEAHRGQQSAFTFLDSDVAVMGDIATIKQIVTNRNQATAIDPTLAQQIQSVGWANDAWFVSLVPGSFFGNHAPANNQPSVQAQARALQSVVQSSGGVRFGDMVDLTLEAVTRSPQDATSLSDVVRFLSSMVQMQRETNPGAGLLASALDGMVLSTSGSTVHVALSVPEQGLEQLAELHPRHPRNHDHQVTK
jgi:hypothetical protein